MEVKVAHKIEAPTGGRIHRVRVTVDPGRKWIQAIKAAGPDTPKQWLKTDIGQAGEQFPPHLEPKPAEREFILVNFGRAVSGQAALDWGMMNCKRNALPREIFAIAQNHPNLNQELKTNGAMALLSLEVCKMGADVFSPVEGELFLAKRRVVECVCAVAWTEKRKRYCKLAELNEFTDICWFAFNVNLDQ